MKKSASSPPAKLPAFPIARRRPRQGKPVESENSAREEPLFYLVFPKGQRKWQMSSRLFEAEIKLMHYHETYSGEAEEACRNLAKAVQCCERGITFDEMNLEGEWPDPLESFRSIILPIAFKLSGLFNANPRDAERKKKETLSWVEGLIDKTFAIRLMTDTDEKRALILIRTANNLCNLLDRFPTKKEVLDKARLDHKALFNLGATKERLLLRMAGLKELPQVRSGGKPPT